MKLNNKIEKSEKSITETIYKYYDWIVYKNPSWLWESFLEGLLWSWTFSIIQIEKDIYKLCEAETLKILSEYQLSKDEITNIEMIVSSRLQKPKELKKMDLNSKISNYLKILVIERLNKQDFIIL